MRYSVAPTAAKQMSIMMRFTENGTLRKASSWISGDAARRSWAIKRPSTTRPAAHMAASSGVTPCAMKVSEQNSRKTAGTISTAPTTSRLPASRATAPRGRALSPTANEIAPIGTLMRKIDSQGNDATSMPPMAGPHIMPSETNVETMPRARPRWSEGNASVTMPMLFAIALATPMPCTARAAMSTGSMVETPQSSEPAVKSATPAWNRRTLPNVSPRRPKTRTVAQQLSR